MEVLVVFYQFGVGRRVGTARGFSLVELMLVLSVVLLILSVMLPAINRARAVSRENVCALKLKQIGTATEAYRADSKRYFNPVYADFKDPGDALAPKSRTYPFRLRAYMGEYQVSQTGLYYSGTDTGRSGRHAFYCPAAPMRVASDFRLLQEPRSADAWMQGPAWDVAISTYTQNVGLGYWDNERSRWLKLKKELAHPERTLLVTEGAVEPRIDPVFYREIQRYWHGNGDLANVLYADLRVAGEKKEEIGFHWTNSEFHLFR
jgi:prepilin-type N-terminal cleavage/methylation domain-containing protein/prepilin-type processing-associated H-X9-DG protein